MVGLQGEAARRWVLRSKSVVFDDQDQVYIWWVREISMYVTDYGRRRKKRQPPTSNKDRAIFHSR